MRDGEIRNIVDRSAALRELFATEPLVLDILQAAELTGIPKSTLYRLVRDSGLAIMVGPAILIGATRLRDLLSARGSVKNGSRDLDHAVAIACDHDDERQPLRARRA